MATHLENRKIKEKYFWWKFMKNCQGKVKENEIVLANNLENFDNTYFISIFCQRIRVISVTFCYTSEKLEPQKNKKLFKSMKSQGKLKLKNVCHAVFVLCCRSCTAIFPLQREHQVSTRDVWRWCAAPRADRDHAGRVRGRALPYHLRPHHRTVLDTATKSQCKFDYKNPIFPNNQLLSI